MNTSAIILMTSVWVIVIFLTIYFFVKIMKNPKHEEPDVFAEIEDFPEEDTE